MGLIFGMTTQAFYLWLTDHAAKPSQAVPRAVQRFVLALARRQPSRKTSRSRPGQFICDRHWHEIESSWQQPDPIDPMSVTVGLTVACGMAGAKGPQTHACCKLNRAGWNGIVARARPSWLREHRLSA